MKGFAGVSVNLEDSFAVNYKNSIPYLTIPAFTQTEKVTHAFTTRLGGVSKGCYVSLNLGLHVGDDLSAVAENRMRICEVLNVNIENMVCAEQVHGDKVMLVTSEHLGCGALSLDNVIQGTDALITAEKNVVLSSYYADCVPLFFLDPVNTVVALAHAGWRGTAKHIGVKVVENMVSIFGSEPKNMLVGIGPSIGSCCYSVDEDVKDCFDGAYESKVFKYKSGRWMLDLKKANKYMLLDAGIEEKNITVSNICTCCKSDVFFSYRASKITGRMASFIAIKGC